VASATAASDAVKGGGAGGASIAAKLDLVDPRLRSLQPCLALLLQPIAFAIEFDRFLQRGLAALELANDLFETFERGLER
jgi:hypothetical protein